MKLLRIFFDIFFPPRCVYCGEFLALGERPLICRKCRDIVSNPEIRCGKCGGVLTYNHSVPECLICKSAGRYFDGVYCASKYYGNTRESILKYKFKGHIHLAEPLTHFTLEGLKRLNIKVDMVLSVPSDPGRRAKRGFDYAGELAKIIADGLNLTYKSNVIKKIKSTPPQSSLTKAQRLKNLKGAFALTGKTTVKDKSILLIDDIFTTGATTSEVSKLLKKKGAKYVFVATLARS